MKDERAGDQIVARIGFAETWLDRARRQVADGNLPRGILTLVLADAEVHHAIEVAGTPRPSAASRVPIAVPVLLLVFVAASAFGLARSSAEPAVLPPDAGAPVIALASRVGSLLRLIPAPPESPAAPVTAVAPAPRPVHAAPPSRPAPPSRRATVAPSAPVTAGNEVVPAVPASAPPVSPPPEPVVQVPPQSTAPITLTAGELIDLVLAAERTLRGVQGR